VTITVNAHVDQAPIAVDDFATALPGRGWNGTATKRAHHNQRLGNDRPGWN
jgi:hypothetical protein